MSELKSLVVSIIILTKDNFSFTKGCLNSIFENTSVVKTPYEVIVVDNGSRDETKPYLQGLEKSGMIKVIYNAENVGFPAGNNQGAKIAKGEYICLLNNDTLVTGGWLEKLLRCIKTDSKLAAVGPYSNAASGNQQSPIACNYNGEDELRRFALRYSEKEQYVNFLVFFCCLIRRSAWNETAGLDEDFGIGNFEDNLFCWRVIEKGYKLKICGDAFVHHFGGASFGYNHDEKKRQAYAELMCRNQKIFLCKIDKYTTIALCMIIADSENLKVLRNCLDSAASWMDQLCMVVNYKHIKNPIRFNKIKQMAADYIQYGCHPTVAYEKWTNFSDMRNKSFDMSKSNYNIWLDCDDVLLSPAGIRDLILHNPQVDAFRFKLLSKTEIGTQEVILHSNLIRNLPQYRFSGLVHEDLNESINKREGKYATSNMVIEHRGYLDLKHWKKKNLRNYALLQQEMKIKEPTSLMYYHLVNCLMIIGGKENIIQAIKYIDECFDKLKPEHDDPITQKMWVLRGVCCMDAGQHLAAKQSLHKAYDEWQNVEAAVNLAELYIREKKHNKVIEILTPIYELKEFKMNNIPFDAIQAECMMLEKLADAYIMKAQNKEGEISEYLKKSADLYHQYLTVRKNVRVFDKLIQLYRRTGQINQASALTLQAINLFPGYFVGFSNMGAFEIEHKRYTTARLFLQESIRLNPKHMEARHNLDMINKIMPRNKKR